MPKYIDVEKADLETLHTSYMGYASKADVAEWLNQQPAVDVEEVVRCMNCKKSRPMIFAGLYVCKRTRSCRTKNDFCSLGIRGDE